MGGTAQTTVTLSFTPSLSQLFLACNSGAYNDVKLFCKSSAARLMPAECMSHRPRNAQLRWQHEQAVADHDAQNRAISLQTSAIALNQTAEY